jgi:hypothetical protein
MLWRSSRLHRAILADLESSTTSARFWAMATLSFSLAS